jgi:hypothetical protein
VTTVAKQQHERRLAKLEEVKRQIASGSLVVREMTAAERAKYPPRLRPGSSRRA